MVRQISVTSVDLRMLVVLSIGGLLSAGTSTFIAGAFIVAGFGWVASGTHTANSLITATVISTESRLEPITSESSWKTYGRPVTYILFALLITAFALV